MTTFGGWEWERERERERDMGNLMVMRKGCSCSVLKRVVINVTVGFWINIECRVG